MKIEKHKFFHMCVYSTFVTETTNMPTAME